MKLKVGDKVYIKPTGQIGVIIRIVDNPFLPDWLSKDWYHIQTDKTNSGNYASCRKRQLKLLK